MPVLRKDFVIDESQVFESRAAGASAVLLIARVLSSSRLQSLAQVVRDCGMVPLIEVHAERELDAALAAGPSVVGVNARDLDTFVVNPRAAEQLIARVPSSMLVVGESGVETRGDVERFAAAGADFVLVGTSVARQADPEAAVRALVGVKWMVQKSRHPYGAALDPASVCADKNFCTALTGTASASPIAIIVLIPMIRPDASARMPPELPGASRRSA